MNSFVVEVTTDAWAGTKVKKVVMQSESELLCYHQALALQKTMCNIPGDSEMVNYEVVAEGYLNDYLNY